MLCPFCPILNVNKKHFPLLLFTHSGYLKKSKNEQPKASRTLSYLLFSTTILTKHRKQQINVIKLHNIIICTYESMIYFFEKK